MALWLSVILPYFLSATVLGQSSSTPRNTTAGWNATTSYGTHSSEHTSSGETLSEESSQKTVSSWSSRDVSGLPSSGPRSPDSDSVSGLGALILSGLGPIVPAETSKAETLTTVSTSGMAPAAYSSNSSQIGLGSKILEGLEPEITKATGFGGQSSSSAPLHSLNETVSVTQITQLSTARLSVFPENITQSEISRSTTTNLSSMSTTFANPRSTSERNSSTLTVTNTRSAQLTAPHIKPNTTDGASKVGLSRNASERNSSSLTVTNTGAAQFTASQIKPNITDGASRVGLSRNNSERDSSTLMVTNTRAAQMTGSHIKPNTTDGASRVGLSRNTFERNSSILTVTNTRAAQMTASHIEPNTTDGASRVGLRSNTSIKYNTTESKFSGNQPARFDTSINRQLNATARSGITTSVSLTSATAESGSVPIAPSGSIINSLAPGLKNATPSVILTTAPFNLTATPITSAPRTTLVPQRASSDRNTTWHNISWWNEEVLGGATYFYPEFISLMFSSYSVNANLSSKCMSSVSDWITNTYLNYATTTTFLLPYNSNGLATTSTLTFWGPMDSPVISFECALNCEGYCAIGRNCTKFDADGLDITNTRSGNYGLGWPPEILFSIFWSDADPSEASYCSSSYSDYWSNTWSPHATECYVTDVTAWGDGIHNTGYDNIMPFLIYGRSSYPSTYLSTGPHTYIATSTRLSRNPTWSLSPSCCGRCTLDAGYADLLYWPESQLGPPITSLIEDGNTFVSPTLYVTFYSITISDWCYMDDGINPPRGGTTYTSHAMALDAVSTMFNSSYLDNGSFLYTYSTINDFAAWASEYESSFVSCTSSWQTHWSTLLEEGYVNSEWLTTYVSEVCAHTFAPAIMLPANIGGDIDPKWSTCAQWNYGIPDPPKALVPAGTVDPAVTKGPSLSIYTAPSPGSTPERAEAPNTAIVTSPSSTSTPALNPVAHTAKQSAGPASDGKQSPSGDGHSLEPESKLSAQEAGVTYPTRTQPVDPLPANPLAASAQLSPSQDPAEPISLLLLGGETLTPVLGSSTLVIMNGQTLIPGAAASVVAGVTISYDRGSIFVNGEGGPVPTMTAAPAALPHWDGSYSVATANTKDFSNALFAPNPAMNSLFVATYGNGQELIGKVLGTSVVDVAGSFVTPGAPAIVVNNARVSVDRSMSQIVVDGEPQALPQPSRSSAPTDPIAAAFSSIFGRPAPQGTDPRLKGGFGNFDTRPVGDPNQILPLGMGNVAGHAITAAPSGAVAFHGTTVRPGDPAVTVKGAVFSLDSTGSVVIDGKTYSLPPVVGAGSNAQPIATVAGNFISMDAFGAVTINGQSLKPGDSAVTISGTRVSLGDAGLVVGPSTIPLPQPQKQIAGFEVTTDGAGNVLISGNTLHPGDPAIWVSGTRVSLGNAGLVVGPSTVPLPQSQNQIAGFEFNTDGAGNVMISGKTLHPGDPAIWVSGTRVSLGSAGLIVGSSTVPLPQSQNQIAGFEFNTDGAGNVLISGNTLHPGDPAIWISGTRISLGTDGLAFGTSTIPLSAIPTRAGQVDFATDAAGDLLISGKTLHPGDPAIWVSGTRISLGSDGLAVGTSTIPLLGIATRVGQVDFATDAAGNLLISGKTLHPGDPPIWVSGTRISLGTDGLAVGTSTIPLLAIPTRAGQVGVTTDAGGNAIIGGTTLHRGDPAITVSGTRISLGDSGLVIGTQTIPISSPSTQIAGLHITTDGAGNVIVNDIILHPGDAAIIISGTKVSLGNNGVLSAGTQTLQVSSLPTAIAGMQVSTDRNGNIILNNGLVIHPGDVITVSGTRVSLGADGMLTAGTITVPTSLFPTEIAGLSITPDGNGNMILNSALVIHPGDAITVSGTRISLGADGILTAGTITVPTSSVPTEIAGISITTDGNGNIILNNTRIIHPGDAVTVSGTRVFLGADGILTAGTFTIPASSFPTGVPPITTDGNGNIIFNNTLIHPGDAVTVSGMRISLGTDGILTAGTFTIPVSSLPASFPAEIAGLSITTDGNGDIILNNTLLIHPGDAITVSGTRISLGSDGTLTAGTFTVPASSLPTAIAGFPITTDSVGDVLIAGTTLHPGDPAITISGTRISLGTNGILTAGSKTIPINIPKVFTVGGLVFTSIAGGVVVGGTTLMNGAPARTINEKLVSVDVNGVVSVGGIWSSELSTTSQVSPAFKETASASLRQVPADGGVAPTATHKKKGGAAGVDMPEWGSQIVLVVVLAWLLHVLVLG